MGENMNRAAIYIYLLSALVFLVSCSRDVHDHPKLTTGKQFFEHHCANCHGEAGTGNFIKGIPANIVTEKNSRELINKIRAGKGHKTGMPIFRKMSLVEAQFIARYLLRLKRDYYVEGKHRDKLLVK